MKSMQKVQRPASEMDIKVRKDRIGRYFKGYLNQFVFDEFSSSYLTKAGVSDIMRGVPIPLREEDLAAFAGGSGIPGLHIVENMTWVMGADPHFEYTSRYAAFLDRLYGKKIYEGMMKKGRDAAENEDYDQACIFFRASLCMDPGYLHSMYSYARVCRSMYLGSDEEEYIGRFKAESLDYFELLTETHPRFAEAYYYLGYAYLNMGLYIKADIAWRSFLEKSNHGKDKREIKERLTQLAGPIEIEHGYNAVLAGRYGEGIARLEPFVKSKFNTWWPLFYYLGVCYERTGRKGEAITSFKKALSINASHMESMEELVKIYGQERDLVNEKKYRNKIELLKGNEES